MKKHLNLVVAGAAIVTSMGLMGSGCPLIPSVEEKIIELAVGSTVILPFEARGSINVYQQTECFDFGDEIDLESILDDAGVDVTDVKEIKLMGVSQRTARAQAGRTIEDAVIKIWRGGCTPGEGEGAAAPDAAATLVADFDGSAGAVNDFQTVDLESAGVDLINAILADLLAEVQGVPTGNPLSGGVNIVGNSEPMDVTTDFDWEIKIDIGILGTVEVDTVDF